ncbi:crotonase/enoyl-CoA hydratase family protein [Oceaniglobus roseus]|uniref:crotonase/enoyl-CoA hydratase family protein n=1 Tax=Oceaniglobus roseus TaxID=1737570 RepID=UPI000C7EA52D|nr:crotonase/enoyl-CoA hydratase family protein [Kandeliimicrobium roseum]
MTYDTLLVDRDARGVARVTLNLPGKRNAMSGRMIEELTHLAGHLATAPETRVIVLEGAGKVFCAGGDLAWMQAQTAADRATRIAEARKLALMLRALNELPVPLISVLHGGAFGGGVGLACVSDVALAARDCRFGLTETRLGLIPATIGPYVVARMGEGKARRVFMSSRLFGAEEARDLGIVAGLFEAAEREAAVAAEVDPYLSVAPGAVAAAKALARSLGPRIDDAVIESTIARLADTWEGEEAAHGIAAFLDRRPARWSGEGGGQG